MTIESKTVTIACGSVWYRVSGIGHAPALVFIHGAMGDSRLYRHQLKHFGKRFRTISLDLPGHGRSECADVPSLDHFIDAIVRVCGEEGVGEVIIAGHSMGGGIALELYKRRVLDVRGIVLVSTAPVLPVPDGLLRMVEENNVEGFNDVLIGSVFSKKIGLLVELARKGAPEMDMEMIRNDIEICRGMDYSSLLGRIDVPVLLIANRGDSVVAHGKTTGMAASIPDSQVVVFDFDGHVPFFEYGAEFNATLDIFIDRVMHRAAASAARLS
ncbi:MAG: alpha/beta hydrolase [Spirochaetes bacterium]|nr:alpha/beta hydrolase [Spirochaetota bacterium]